MMEFDLPFLKRLRGIVEACHSAAVSRQHGRTCRGVGASLFPLYAFLTSKVALGPVGDGRKTSDSQRIASAYIGGATSVTRSQKARHRAGGHEVADPPWRLRPSRHEVRCCWIRWLRRGRWDYLRDAYI